MLPAGAKTQVSSLWALCVGILSFLQFNPGHAETIRLQGSTTFTAQILQPFQNSIEAATGHKLDVVANKTTPGLIALLEGKTDLAMISGPLDHVIGLAKKTHPDLPYAALRSFTVARTRVGFPVHADNPVRSISTDRLRRVLRGEIENWKELGGLDLPIRVVMVREGGGVKLTVENELLLGEPIKVHDPILLPNGPRIVRVVEQEQGALGLSQFNLVKRFNLPELQLEHGVTQELALVTLGEPTPALRAVINAMRDAAKSDSD
jgi:phosphate transport system substrate-binding protein